MIGGTEQRMGRTFGKSKAITLEVQTSDLFMEFVTKFIDKLDITHEDKIVAIDTIKHSDGDIGSIVFNVMFDIMRKQPSVPNMSGIWAKYYDSWYADFLRQWSMYQLCLDKGLREVGDI